MLHRSARLIGMGIALLIVVLPLLPTPSVAATVGLMQITVDTTLTEDHNGPIEIVADDVALNCGGHKVTGEGSGIGVAVASRSGVSVRDCDVSGFASGIVLDNSSSNVIEGNHVHDNLGGSGIRLIGSGSNEVRNNTVARNGDEGIGIVLHYGRDAGNVVDANIVTDNGGSGIYLDPGYNNVISNNRVERNAWGVSLSDSYGNSIRGNYAERNLNSGFVIGGFGNVLIGNEAHGHPRFGFTAGCSPTPCPAPPDAPPIPWHESFSANHCTNNTEGNSRPVGLCQEERVGLVDTASGEWHLRHSPGRVTSFYYGNPGDVPFLGDWDCDGVATPGLFRSSDAYAYLRNSNTQGIADTRFFFGNPSDIPLAGDFNGDGCDTLSIYRPSEARFYIMNNLGENEGGLGAADYSFLFGNVGDKPVVGDWDADGIDEIGLHRDTTGFFYYRNTLTTGTADGQLFFGDPGDRFVAGDWGVVDGVDTPAMFRPSNSTFYFRHTLTQGNADSQFTWIGAGMGWLPVSGDFTLD